MLASLGWRNLWRNKRRTLIAISSVVFALIFAIWMRSGQEGQYAFMIESMVKQYTGYLQVQGKDYWENRSIDESFYIDAKQIEEIDALEHVTLVNPRLESFALVSLGDLTKVANVVGINPDKEHAMNGLRDKIVEGEYLDGTSAGIVLAEGLAKNIGASLGDSIVVYGQGYHGSIAAGILEVTGIAKFPVNEQNNFMAYVSLQNAQVLFATYDLITSLTLMLEDIEYLEEVKPRVKAIVDKDYAIMTWDEMMPETLQQIEADKAGGVIMLGILYMIIGFGLFGTVMMMTAERVREFGILISVGMKRRKLSIVTTIESILIAVVGGLIGVGISIPWIWYWHNNPIRFEGDMAKMFDIYGVEPIMPFDFSYSIFLEQTIIVLFLALLTAIYPIMYVRKLKPMNAIRG
jgi:ABC-type lipoprotein release transport system permease subunit